MSRFSRRAHLLSSAVFASILAALFQQAFCRPVLADALPPGIPSWRRLPYETLKPILDNGALVSVHPLEGTVELCAIGLVADAPREKVWDVIVDFPGYEKDLVPGLASAKRLTGDEKTANVRFDVTVLSMGPINISTDYVLKYDFDKPSRADINWVEGKVKNVRGFWELTPVENGRKTLIVYGITSDLSSSNALVAAALKDQPSTVTAINLSSAILLAGNVAKKAEENSGRGRKANGGGKPAWEAMSEKTLDAFLKDSRIGVIQYETGGDLRAVAARKTSASPKEAMDVVLDFEKYPDFIRQVTLADVTKKEKDSIWVRQNVYIMKIGPIKIGSESVSRYDRLPDGAWRARDEKHKDRKDLFTRIEVRPLPGKGKSAILYSIKSDMKNYGKIASLLIEKQPSFQISIDLATALAITEEIGQEAEKRAGRRAPGR